MRQYNVGAPFERIAMDVVGPFPKSDNGNKYVLVVMDYFSKWPEAYPLPNQETRTIADAVVQNWISRYGVPMEVNTDQGRNFESVVFQELCQLLGINKTRTTPLHPQSDGMVERFNRTFEEYLAKVVDKNQRDWDKHIPLFLMAYRSAMHETTGTTPAKVIFGNDLRLPGDMRFGAVPSSAFCGQEYVDKMKEELNEIHQFVREKTGLSSDRSKARYDTRANNRGFEEGQLVWLYNPQRKKGLSPKFQPEWEGPYTVVTRINDVIYRIQKGPRYKPKIVHLERLALYKGMSTDSVRDEQA
jgi:transposase InsO family protein